MAENVKSWAPGSMGRAIGGSVAADSCSSGTSGGLAHRPAAACRDADLGTLGLLLLLNGASERWSARVQDLVSQQRFSSPVCSSCCKLKAEDLPTSSLLLSWRALFRPCVQGSGRQPPIDPPSAGLNSEAGASRDKRDPVKSFCEQPLPPTGTACHRSPYAAMRPTRPWLRAVARTL